MAAAGRAGRSAGRTGYNRTGNGRTGSAGTGYARETGNVRSGYAGEMRGGRSGRAGGSRSAGTGYAGGVREDAYVYGSAARKLDIDRQIGAPQKQLSHMARKNRQRAHYMNPAYLLFLSLAMAVTGFVLIGYIRLQSGITTSVEKISRLESQLNNLKLENDEMLSRIESSVDLDEIRRIAITELGMVYAGDGQIVEIPSEGSDYVRQYAQIHP